MGRYQLLERIGEGGMGVVWRSFDLDLEEPVAVKFLREDLVNDPGLRASFRREVKLARRVTHPNVARVFEFGRDGDLFYLTMEFIEGETLLALLDREGALLADPALALAVSLCRGLAAAHAANVVHGDIKPGNILLAPGRGAVLTDFGIARNLAEVQVDADGSIGTPIYMAPEQFAGETKTLRSDVYAVGVVLFEALTGEVPWPCNDIVALLDFKHSRREPDLAAIAPDLPAPWRALLTDCLRSDPALRPPDARALLARLAAMHEGPIPTTARPTPAPLATPNGPRWVEISQFHGEHDGDADWLTSDVIGALTNVRGLRVMAGGPEEPPVARRAQVHGGLRKVDDGVVVELEVVDNQTHAPLARIDVHKPQGDLHNLGAEVAARIITALVDPAVAPQLRGHDDLDPSAVELYTHARAAFTAMRVAEAVRLFEAATRRSPGSAALRLGHVLATTKSLVMLRQPSLDDLCRVRELAESALAEFGDRGEAHLNMAGVLLTVNEPVAAAAFAREAIARSPNLVPAIVLLAGMLLEIGRLPDAERRLDIALALDGASVQAHLLRAQLFAYHGRWDDLRALLAGPLARFRNAHTLRLLLWNDDELTLARTAAALADNPDHLPEPGWRDACDLVEFARDRGRRRAAFEQMRTRHRGDQRTRQTRLVAQLLCEMACILGDREQAREQLLVADQCALYDWQWIERCPILTALRDEPSFEAVRARVRARADSVAEAVWG